MPHEVSGSQLVTCWYDDKLDTFSIEEESLKTMDGEEGRLIIRVLCKTSESGEGVRNATSGMKP